MTIFSFAQPCLSRLLISRFDILRFDQDTGESRLIARVLKRGEVSVQLLRRGSGNVFAGGMWSFLSCSLKSKRKARQCKEIEGW